MYYVRCLLFRETRRKRNGRREEELLETASIFKLVRSRAGEEKETALSEFVRLKIYPMRVVYQAAPVPPFHPLPLPQPRSHLPLFPREFALSIFFSLSLLHPVSLLYFQFSSSSLFLFFFSFSLVLSPLLFFSCHQRCSSIISSITRVEKPTKYFITGFCVVTGFEDCEEFNNWRRHPSPQLLKFAGKFSRLEGGWSEESLMGVRRKSSRMNYEWCDPFSREYKISARRVADDTTLRRFFFFFFFFFFLFFFFFCDTM